MSRSRLYGFILVVFCAASSTPTVAAGAHHSDFVCKMDQSEPGKIDCHRELQHQSQADAVQGVSTTGSISCLFADGEVHCLEMEQQSTSAVHDVTTADEFSCIAFAGRVHCE